ncbi:MAG: hypothetical protein IID31_12945 [Planctomycetes bacterium]|nr:hypothetical protein [Planctomycetota bacterium]
MSGTAQTQFAFGGYGTRRYGSFADKALVGSQTTRAVTIRVGQDPGVTVNVGQDPGVTVGVGQDPGVSIGV